MDQSRFLVLFSIILIFATLSFTIDKPLSISAQLSTPGTTVDIPRQAGGILELGHPGMAFENSNNPVSICGVCQ